jgi:predicted aspartyl protease
MISKGASGVGRFAIEFEITNNDDAALARRGLLAEDKVRRLTISGVVDSGAARLVLPQSVARQLGLKKTGETKVRYADGRTGRRNVVEPVAVEILGRRGVFTPIVEVKRQTALVGAIVLEDLDLLVDCTNQKLVPRDPNFVISELEGGISRLH